MSFTKEEEKLYRAGFKKPTVDWPLATLAEFTNDTIPATTGHEADVPDTEKRATTTEAPLSENTF